jgi:DNA-binding transcriptional regulator/RsmH inhibitor MraZ
MRDYSRSVLDVVQDLHGEISGSGAGNIYLEGKTVEGEAAWLKEQLVNWTPSIDCFSQYDDAIKAVVLAVLAEVEWDKRGRPRVDTQKESEQNDSVIMARAEWEAIKKHMEDLERSAASAREIARAAMSSTGTRAMRVELISRNDGISVIVCDPAGDEMATTKRMAAFLDKALWAQIGVEFPDKDPIPTGSTA